MLTTKRHDDILEITFARPPVNALNPALVEALHEALDGAASSGAKAIVFSGRPGLFSAGLDLFELLTFDRPTMRKFWVRFFGLLERIARSPIPTAAAITGNSPAGGTVLAMWCDYRVFAAGPHVMGLNETQVGIELPPLILRGLSHLVGPRHAERMGVGGLLVGPDEALRTGLVDEVTTIDETVPRSLEAMRRLLALAPGAMLRTRRTARTPLVAIFDDLNDATIDLFLEGWFSDETQWVLKAVIARLKAKK